MRLRSLLPIAALLAACTVPRDPDDTLHRVEGGALRVGVALNAPWTTDSAGSLGGIEPALVRALAAELRAEVAWTTGGEGVVMPLLHERELDLVIGGIDVKTPWAKQVGVTPPWHTVTGRETRELVWAVAPGENAWQMRVERFLREQKPRIAAAAPRAVTPHAR